MQWTASNKVKCSGYAFKVLHLSYPKFECITRVYYQDLQEKIHTGQTISKCCVQFRVQINSLEKRSWKQQQHRKELPRMMNVSKPRPRMSHEEGVQLK